MVHSSFWLLAGVVIALLPLSNGFYLPGAAPHNYEMGDKVDLFVNALTPILSGNDDAKLVLHSYLLLLNHTE